MRKLLILAALNISFLLFSCGNGATRVIDFTVPKDAQDPVTVIEVDPDEPPAGGGALDFGSVDLLVNQNASEVGVDTSKDDSNSDPISGISIDSIPTEIPTTVPIDIGGGSTQGEQDSAGSGSQQDSSDSSDLGGGQPQLRPSCSISFVQDPAVPEFPGESRPRNPTRAVQDSTPVYEVKTTNADKYEISENGFFIKTVSESLGLQRFNAKDKISGSDLEVSVTVFSNGESATCKKTIRHEPLALLCDAPGLRKNSSGVFIDPGREFKTFIARLNFVDPTEDLPTISGRKIYKGFRFDGSRESSFRNLKLGSWQADSTFGAVFWEGPVSINLSSDSFRAHFSLIEFTYQFTTTYKGLNLFCESKIEAQFNRTPGSPLALNLDGEQIKLSSQEDGVEFDLTNDGEVETISWMLESNTGLLAFDRNMDGIISNGSELFGNYTVLNNGETADNGFQALEELDANKDGKVDQEDPAYALLLFWQDENRDGVSDQEELKTLEEVGILEVLVTYTNTDIIDEYGNGYFQHSFASIQKPGTSDIQNVDVWDIWFDLNYSDAINR